MLLHINSFLSKLSHGNQLQLTIEQRNQKIKYTRDCEFIEVQKRLSVHPDILFNSSSFSVN